MKQKSVIKESASSNQRLGIRDWSASGQVQNAEGRMVAERGAAADGKCTGIFTELLKSGACGGRREVARTNVQWRNQATGAGT